MDINTFSNPITSETVVSNSGVCMERRHLEIFFHTLDFPTCFNIHMMYFCNQHKIQARVNITPITSFVCTHTSYITLINPILEKLAFNVLFW